MSIQSSESNENVKSIRIYAKCADRFAWKLFDESNNLIAEAQETYVPGWMPSKWYSEDIHFLIDIETGQILNWVPPTEEDLQEMIDEQDGLD